MAGFFMGPVMIGTSTLDTSGYVGSVSAAPGGVPGPPDPGGNEPPDYGDLIILYRDAYGVPILTDEIHLCRQPIAFPSESCTPDCGGMDPCLIPVVPETCAIEAGYEACAKEIEFGRVNEARSPETVFETRLEDVVVNLATADCISLDPAGRLVTSRVEDGIVNTSAIDSPLQNLAIYRQLVLTGYLGSDPGIALPDGALITAARPFGVASDKTGEVNVDMLAYINQIMGLTDAGTTTILDPKICINVREEVMGVAQKVQKCFLNYEPFAYRRVANFGVLPAPAYIPELEPMEGWFEYLDLWLEATGEDPDLFYVHQGPVMDAVFGIEPGDTDGNIGGFAQAADDTRAVIEFMHQNPAPEGYATAVPCEGSGDVFYDLSISEQSGLQVPMQYVNGTEREFTVTVGNESGSPDAASGTVTVTAKEGDELIETWSFAFADLGPGMSESWTEMFIIDLGHSGSITWTATVEAEFDVNPLNNTVIVTTNVKNTAGGGGHLRARAGECVTGNESPDHHGPGGSSRGETKQDASNPRTLR